MRGELQGSFEVTKGVQAVDSESPGGSYKSWIENQVRLRA